MREIWRKALVVAGVALAAGGGYLASRVAHQGGHQRVAVQSATVLEAEKPLPAFSLQGPNGAFGNGQLAGKWSFVFFGYTHCPDVCPTALSLLRDVRARLTADGVAALPQVVFVSVDGARDSRELLDRYVPAFDPSFVGLRGSDEEIAPLVKALGVFYQRHEKEDPRNYTVDHSAAIYLIDPQGRLAAVFMPPLTPDVMAKDYRAVTTR